MNICLYVKALNIWFASNLFYITCLWALKSSILPNQVLKNPGDIAHRCELKFTSVCDSLDSSVMWQAHRCVGTHYLLNMSWPVWLIKVKNQNFVNECVFASCAVSRSVFAPWGGQWESNYLQFKPMTLWCPHSKHERWKQQLGFSFYYSL